jgi:hypothetical protein
VTYHVDVLLSNAPSSIALRRWSERFARVFEDTRLLRQFEPVFRFAACLPWRTHANGRSCQLGAVLRHQQPQRHRYEVEALRWPTSRLVPILSTTRQ